MSEQPASFQNWLTDFQSFHLPHWQDFPDFEIYMDQLVNLVNQYLEPLMLDPVTPTMINNYVKKQVMFKPNKKRYRREHLAAVVTLTLLKTAFPLELIKEGFNTELTNLSAEAAYEHFVTTFTDKVQALSVTQPQPLPSADFTPALVLQETAATTIIYQLTSKALMELTSANKGVSAHDKSTK
jgi:hypothetical protein